MTPTPKNIGNAREGNLGGAGEQALSGCAIISTSTKATPQEDETPANLLNCIEAYSKEKRWP
jgi:hypothetical protein